MIHPYHAHPSSFAVSLHVSFEAVVFTLHTVLIHIYHIFFLGHEQAWTNTPVEESLAQSHSPAAPSVREEAQCSTRHRIQQAFPINIAPAVAESIQSILLSHPMSLPVLPVSLLLLFHSAGVGFLTLLWTAWPFPSASSSSGGQGHVTGK